MIICSKGIERMSKGKGPAYLYRAWEDIYINFKDFPSSLKPGKATVICEPAENSALAVPKEFLE